jgi:DNA invertase Pin-like site-specific DNA recombinase
MIIDLCKRIVYNITKATIEGRTHMKIGYIRVSTTGQNIDRQLTKMKELGIEDRFIFIDKQSGKDFEREQYQAMKRIIREGDLLYVDALDRLGRDYEGIIKEWKQITREMQADIIVLENETLFDSRKFKSMGDMGKLMEDQFLSLLSYVADQERKKIRQRQAEGIAVAKEKGKHLGRPKMNLDALSKEQRKALDQFYPYWKDGEITAVEFMSKLNLKKNTFYKIVNEYEVQKDAS